jgi:hypothetical protein
MNDPLKAADVPVFNCMVYVSRTEDRVRARVANLAGIESTAGSEREALSEVVKVFKQRVAEWTRSQSPIPWIDPPSPPEPEELARLIAVHL